MQSNLTIQFCSDLHLEFYNNKAIDYQKLVKPSASILALLGDIGHPTESHYSDFIDYCAKHFQFVLIISGNHEYYCNKVTIDKTAIDQIINYICYQYSNVFYLNRASKVINGYRFIGATLWSDIPRKNFDFITNYLNDYNLIYYTNNKKVTPIITNAWHQQDLAFIKSELKQAKTNNQEVVVLTHHCPLINGTSHPMFLDSPSNCAFASDLAYLFNPNLRYWLCGHTHFNFNISYNNTIIMSNQVGYPNSGNTKDYNNSKVIKL